MNNSRMGNVYKTANNQYFLCINDDEEHGFQLMNKPMTAVYMGSELPELVIVKTCKVHDTPRNYVIVTKDANVCVHKGDGGICTIDDQRMAKLIA